MKSRPVLVVRDELSREDVVVLIEVAEAAKDLADLYASSRGGPRLVRLREALARLEFEAKR